MRRSMMRDIAAWTMASPVSGRRSWSRVSLRERDSHAKVRSMALSQMTRSA